MEAIDKLRNEFLKQAHSGGPLPLYDATVSAVYTEDTADNDAYTCDILLDDLQVFGVRLRAVVSANQSLDMLPEEGAQVVVGKMGDDDYIVIACDKITSYRLTVGTAVFTVDANGTLISKGVETLNKILTDLVNGLLSVAAPKDVPGITLLLDRINNLLK